MPTKCKFNNGHQVFSGNPQFISSGKITDIATVVNVTAETALYTESFVAGVFTNTAQQFKLTVTGTISSDGLGDVALTLRWLTTDILEFLTVSYPDEDDKAFTLEITGRILTVGASGKIVAGGFLKMAATGMADIVKATALAGVAVDTTIAGSINLTADFDVTSADCDVIVYSAILQLFD